MTVQHLTLEHFRNYTLLDADFHPGVNVIVGENAQGKTNLLEAVGYLSSGGSHRARNHRELVQFGAPRAHVVGKLFNGQRELVLDAQLPVGGRRKFTCNGVGLKTLGELSGLLPSVLFCPEDLHLIREGAGVRRRFLNDCICQLRPRYAMALSNYRRLWEHKTRILRDCAEKPSLLDALDAFSQQMAEYGAILIHYRAHFVRRLQETAPAIHADCAGGGEKLELSYHTVSTVTDPLAAPKVILHQLLDHMDSHRRAEIQSRSCLSGPHKDDLALSINGQSAKGFASQGQTRTAALALKLAARDIMWQDTGQWPVLLLDDVLSELDRRRQEFVLNRISTGQVFITCCEVEKEEWLQEGKVFHISQGALQEE